MSKMSVNKPNRPMFIRKSSGVGWSLNPNHPVTWSVLLGILIIIVYTVFTH